MLFVVFKARFAFFVLFYARKVSRIWFWGAPLGWKNEK